MPLEIIAPDDRPNSKCWQVFNPLAAGWPKQSASNQSVTCVWGLGGRNYHITKSCVEQQSSWLFADMPYFNRWMGEHTADSCHWRLIPKALHESKIHDYPDDRSKTLLKEVREWRTNGIHVLIAPSSDSITRWMTGMSSEQWLRNTLKDLAQHTDRIIRVRYKPRKHGMSGPMVQDVPVADDLKDCWAVVTLCSIVGVEAAVAGIPVISHQSSATAAVSTQDLADIESPCMPDRGRWLNTLSYRQFTKAEMRSGLAHEILHQLL